MRQEIIKLGGQVRFDTRLTGLMMRGESIEGITVLCGGETQEIRADTLILAIGHSARDTGKACAWSRSHSPWVCALSIRKRSSARANTENAGRTPR